MRLALASPALCLVILLSSAVAGGSAWAGPALDDDKAKEHTPPPPPELATPVDPVEYGVGVRARSVWVPKAVLELFVDRAAGGAQNFGLGVDLTRRRGTTELQLGFEWERVNVGQGVWINRGENVAAGDEADFVLGPKASGHQLSWFTVEFTFINHAEINKTFAVRYGGGLGLGILIGELDHYNIICAAGSTNAAPEPGCVPSRFGGQGRYSEDPADMPGSGIVFAYDLPPVFPVVNAIVGLQIKPTASMTINIEGGIRTLPFLGVSASTFF
jgi:hypothetical protein